MIYFDYCVAKPLPKYDQVILVNRLGPEDYSSCHPVGAVVRKLGAKSASRSGNTEIPWFIFDHKLQYYKYLGNPIKFFCKCCAKS